MYTVVIRRPGGRDERYTVDGGRWSGPVPAIVNYAEILSIEVRGYQPDPDHALAVHVAAALGGQVAEDSEPEELPEGATP